MMKKVLCFMVFLLTIAACGYAASGPQNFPQGEIRLGANDATRGTVTAYGDNNTSGALVTLHNAANEDTSAQAYRIMPDGNKLTIGTINATTGAYAYIIELLFGGGLNMNGGTLDTNGGSIATDGGSLALTGGNITGAGTVTGGTFNSSVLYNGQQVILGADGPFSGNTLQIYKLLGSGNIIDMQGASSTKAWIDRFTNLVTSGTLRTNQTITSGDDLITADDATIGDDLTVNGKATIAGITIDGDIYGVREVVASSGDFTSAEVDTLNLPTAPAGRLMLSGVPVTYVPDDVTSAVLTGSASGPVWRSLPPGNLPSIAGEGEKVLHVKTDESGVEWVDADSLPGIVTNTTLAKANAMDYGIASFNPTDFNDNGGGLISIDFANGQAATSGQDGLLQSGDWTTFNNKVGTARSISTTSPLSGGGDLSANRTISIGDAAADGATKGASAFNANNFDAASGVVNLDFTNGQKATSGQHGFLSSTD